MFNRSTIHSLLFAVFTWCLLLSFAGYRFGTGDHREYLPYTQYLQNPALFPHDFFIQGLAAKPINERTVMGYMLLPFINHLELVCFILNFLVTVLLLVGIQKLGQLLTGSITATRIAILVNFILFFDRGLGNVELYSDAVQGSSMSVALIVFALYYFFKQRYLLASFIMALASLLHPVEGLTVYLVLAASMFVIVVLNKNRSVAVFLKFLLIYALVAGIFIAYLLAGKVDGINAFSQQFDQERFYQIYHVFRHAHHYIFQYLPLTEKLLFLLFITINLLWGYTNNKKFFWFNVATLLGIITYIIATDYLHIIDIANLQFYKVTQYTKLFAILILVNYLHSFFSAQIRLQIRSRYLIIAGAVIAVTLFGILFFNASALNRPGIEHECGLHWKQKNQALQIALQIDKQISKQAVFIQPIDMTELKFFGKVSSFVEFKAFVKNRSLTFEWYRRINQVYGINMEDKKKGFDLMQKANQFFYNLDSSTIQQLKKQGVTHLLTTNKNYPFGTLLFQNNTYAVYQL